MRKRPNTPLRLVEMPYYVQPSPKNEFDGLTPMERFWAITRLLAVVAGRSARAVDDPPPQHERMRKTA